MHTYTNHRNHNLAAHVIIIFFNCHDNVHELKKKIKLKNLYYDILQSVCLFVSRNSPCIFGTLGCNFARTFKNHPGKVLSQNVMI